MKESRALMSPVEEGMPEVEVLKMEEEKMMVAVEMQEAADSTCSMSLRSS